MMRGRQTHLALLAVAALMGGCFVDSSDPGYLVELRLSLNAPGSSVMATGATFSPWDSEGVFQLEKWSKYVRVAVEHKDGYELEPLQDARQGGQASDACPLCYPGSWPSPAKGIGAGEGEYGEVEVELKLPAGDNRRLRALAYLVETGKLRVYKEDTVKTSAGKKVESMDLTAGSELDLRVSMTGHPAGKVNATFRCSTTSTDDYVPYRLALRDAWAQVQYPFQVLTEGTDSYTAEVTGVPVGRPHYTVVQLKHPTDERKLKTVVVKKPSFTVSMANDTQVVNLDIPCNF